MWTRATRPRDPSIYSKQSHNMKAGVTKVKQIIVLTVLFAAMLIASNSGPRPGRNERSLSRPDRRQQDGPSSTGGGSLQLLRTALQSLLLPSHRPAECPAGLDSSQRAGVCSARAICSILGQLHLRKPAAHVWTSILSATTSSDLSSCTTTKSCWRSISMEQIVSPDSSRIQCPNPSRRYLVGAAIADGKDQKCG